GFSETNDTPPTPRNDDVAPDTYYIGATTDDEVMPDRPELAPADRRPPAQLPDWARDGGATRTKSSTTEVRQYNTTTGGAPIEPAANPDRGSTYAARTTGATTAQPGATTMGVMVEVSSGAATNRPAPATNWNPPATTGTTHYAAAPTTTNTTTGAGIVEYNRPDPTTLTLNATNSSVPSSTTTTPRPVANTPIASNQPIAANTTHAPRTIVDPRNSHPAAPMGSGYTTDSGYTTTTQSPGVTTSDTYYINSESTTAYASNTPVQNAPTTGQGDFAYPTPSTPPPEVPIDPATGPYAAKLVTLEGDLHAIMDLPVQQRPYEQLIARYEEISIQSGERVPAEYAAIRIDQLKALERVRRLAVRYASDHDGLEHFSRRMEEERAEIRSAQQTTTTIQGGAFEYEGLLMRSYAFSPEKRRYRLVDPGTQSTIIYVDIPVAVYGNPDALNGKRVGIRVNRREYSDAAQIPIVEAASIVDLTAPPTKYQTIPGPQARKNADFSNPANTGRDNPNPLMNAPMAREHSESAPMGEMTRIES
ncbi:MAG: hypothetical protein KDA33_03685, partial [Phycisphaerales bacterium]|nr:hypothetical protein [Phycisphaerales bacterium]